MAASRNEATGDVLANVKGRADAYADGWDRIFGKKEAVILKPAPFLSESDPRRSEVGVAVIDAELTPPKP